MNEAMEKHWAFETEAIRGGVQITSECEHSEAIYFASSFVFENAQQAAEVFALETGNVYSRFTNPTVAAFERRMALLEQGERAVATASGMSALLCVCLGLLKSGDEIIASHSLFGSSISLLGDFLTKFNIQTHFVALSDLSQWKKAINAKTRLLFAETPSNPLCELVDIRALSQLIENHEAKLLIDNTFCTPALQQPLTLGADLVIHSASKFLDGHGRAIGGVVVGRDATSMDLIYKMLRTTGPCMSAMNAWMFMQGIETLALRMQTQSAHAQQLAHWLDQHPAVLTVHYCGLTQHAQHELAKRQQKAFGAVIGFEVKGGQTGAWFVIDALKWISITGNLGDTKTTITHPASTTHGKLTPLKKEEAKITPGLLRLSVGLESVKDIQKDLAQGLDALASMTVALDSTPLSSIESFES